MVQLNFHVLRSNYDPLAHFGGECGKWSNAQCAMRMSSALLKSGFSLAGYTDWMCTADDGNKYARGAQSLTQYLSNNYAKSIPIDTPLLAEGKLKGKYGIILFQDIEGYQGGRGDHIDLWENDSVVGSGYFDRCTKVVFIPVTRVEWECWIRRNSCAVKVKIDNGGIIGVFQTQDEAESEKTADKAWQKPWGWESWIRKSTQAIRVKIYNSGIIGVFKTQMEAEVEKELGSGSAWEKIRSDAD